MAKKKSDYSLPVAAIEKAHRYYSQGFYPNEEEFLPGRFENPDPVSMTIPDQSYTIEQLFARSRQGLTVPGNNAPVYNGDFDVPMFEKMDFADRVAYLDSLKEHNRELTEKVKKQEQARKDAEAKILADRTLKERAELLAAIKAERSDQ